MLILHIQRFSSTGKVLFLLLQCSEGEDISPPCPSFCMVYTQGHTRDRFLSFPHCTQAQLQPGQTCRWTGPGGSPLCEDPVSCNDRRRHSKCVSVCVCLPAFWVTTKKGGERGREGERAGEHVLPPRQDLQPISAQEPPSRLQH